MDFEIIIKGATIEQIRELFNLKQKGTVIKQIDSVRAEPESAGPQSQQVPVEIVSARVVEKRISKYQIPFSYKTEKKLYQNAWHLCRKWNLPYPEAKLKAEAAGMKLNPEPKHKAPTVTIGDMGMVKIKNPAPVTMDMIPKSESVVGWKVKQIKADRGRTIPGIPLVTARKNGSGLIECLHEGKRQVIDATCLEVVERV